MKISKKLSAAVAVPSALPIGGSIAIAAWNVTGAGSGAAKAATLTALVVNTAAPR